MFIHFTSLSAGRAGRAVVAASGIALAVAAVGGCSGGGADAKGSSSPDAATSVASGAPSRSGNGLGGPAASGEIADITGSTMQVQNPQSGQVAVSWSAGTKFSHTVATTLAAVKAGSCVTAMAPSGTSATAKAFTTTSLIVSRANAGGCTGGLQPGRNRPSGVPTDALPPSGARPSGAGPSGVRRPNAGALASGKVVSVSGSRLVIAARSFGAGNIATTQKTVTVGAATKITTEAATTSASLKVGRCVTAEGKADTSGTVAATTVRITDATSGRCAITFGGRPGNG